MAVSVIPTLDLERAIAEQGYDVIVGFDEVGRGSLAGPVMVGAAAIWARDLGGFSGVRGGESAGRGESGESGDLDGAEAEAAGGASGAGVAPLEVPKGVADSKMLTERKREAIFDELEQWCAAWAVGAASNTEIDEWGISYALGVAALRALAEVERKLGVGGGESAGIAGSSESSEALNNLKIGAILDGPNDYITKALNTFDAPDVPIPADVTCKVKGDRYCAAVAAAAVIAKVTRDRLMVELGAQPQYEPYEWAHNKGYGSAAHRDAIAEFGPSDLHRLSWHLV
ncbi:ribonuclease HII [Bifidobacterium pseudocatenulatum]|jgi:ribonuclease HII|uniref:Ribonuclease n=1 Tax=Bifidobacterium pseudocatenulatum TaxID=28026 RepID=A0A413C7M1_BIFPS|nr:ribonuclease HII [Bifidobacterium pseudocatenulatum]RGJ12694.1 ribonuclease HII [Bifidobacterium pseudocatenulatum]RGW60041.1 ribonuclease HII [Bifidobacterium pseudocatenulatum]RGY77605.1 ribonuclease HII [Bifidobacterium pseudocatenulatum]RHF16576.1 ribonuclease HII [Bifidobacterium pseudocatenulatum]RHG80733.1 ribonuclease HII [Bifidobacterium pseudocatenulatum]